jgi:hypothetical protein
MRSVILPCCGEVVLFNSGPESINCPACAEPFHEGEIEELQISQAPMMRPLFEEPTPEIEREDPFSGKQGFMIGGMALPTNEEMGQQYFEAANLLVESIKRGDWEDYRLPNPVLFLYRHSIEMMLKGIMQSAPKTHDLAKLADGFEAFIKQKCGRMVPSWITARLKEIAAIDPTSTAFRYSQYYCKKTKQYVFVDGEIYISLTHLQEAMKVLTAALNAVFEAACRIELQRKAS